MTPSVLSTLFCDLIGNEKAKRTLQHFIETGSIPNTLLFSGLRGVGKSKFAQAFACALMGEKHISKIKSGHHPDIHELYPEGKTAMHSIISILGMIDEVSLPPFEAPVKVFILHEAHRMLPSSSNALLKILEEPPSDTIFILLSSQPKEILPTIVSRCRIVSFYAVGREEISGFIQKQFGKSEEEATSIAFWSQGSVAKACTLAQNEDAFFKLVLNVLKDSRSYFLLLQKLTKLEEHLEEEKEKQNELNVIEKLESLWEAILYWYKEAHLVQEGILNSVPFLFYRDSLSDLQTFSKYPLPSLLQVTQAIEQARVALQHNIRLRTVLEHLFLTLNFGYLNFPAQPSFERKVEK
jgi:DNA polymerase-3 subunit delta'